MARIYMERLIKTVIELSHGNDWDTAVVEWEIIDCEEDSTLSESCICGKEHLFYLFTIKNIITGSTLFPIGSSCIKTPNSFRFRQSSCPGNSLKSYLKMVHLIVNTMITTDWMTMSSL